MDLLLVSILVLLVGPLLYWGFRRDGRMLVVLDGFNFVAIAGLVLFDILPHAFESAGGWVILFALLGLVGPTLLERYVHRAGHGAHATAVYLAIVGLCVHAMLDGAGLVEAHDDHDSDHAHSHLPLAVILHRIPVGLTVWMLLRGGRGRLFTWVTLLLMAACTVLGFVVGHTVFENLTGVVPASIQALIAGMLMHVVIHRPHRREESGPIRRQGLLEGIGGLFGLGLLTVTFADRLIHEGEFANPVVKTFVEFALESAPALLLGYLVAGFVSVLLPTSSIRWMKRGRAWNQSLRGMAVGLPIPVCSCGVVPIYRSLVQRGAPATAAMAFLVATPELGFDAVFLTFSLLGLELTVIRVAAAALVALLVGWIVGGWTTRNTQSANAVEEESCCSTDPDVKASFAGRLRDGLKVGLGEVVDHTGPWIVLGIAVAALVGPLLENDWLTSISPHLQVPLFALVGIPMYVCASGATPLVAVLLINGLSPGAAIAFLLTGPATNTTTFGVLSRLHSRRAAAGFGIVMMALSVSVGFLVNALFPQATAVGIGAHHAGATSNVQLVCLVLLVVTYLSSFLRRGPRSFVAEIFQFDESEEDAEAEPPVVGHDHSHGHGHRE